MVEFEDELEEEFDEEFDDEFEEDWEEFEPEPEEFFTGPLYIPTESSVNLELYSLFGSIVVMLVAAFLLYTKVLVGVYDAGLGSGTMEEKMAAYDYQLAQQKVEIVGFGQYNNEDKSGAYDYAVLDAGSKQGLVPGMIFYFKAADGNGPRNGYWTAGADYLAGSPSAKDLTMMVVKKVDDNSAWAIFAKYITEEDKAAFKTASGKEFKNVLYGERLVPANAPSYIEYTNLKTPVLETPFPYSPKALKPFQYFIWEEAFDLSGEKIYKPITLETIDKDFNTVEDSSFEDYADSNVEWNMMKRVTLTFDDIKKLLQISGTDAINKQASMIEDDDSKGKIENAIVIFNDSQYVFLAPPVDQSLFNVVYKLLAE